MNKFKLYSIGNEGNFSYYVLDKKQEVFNILKKIFLLDFNIDWSLCHCDSEENKKINIEKYTDIHEGDGDEKVQIDIFYGKNRMYLTLICPSRFKIKFNEALFKYVEMPKPIKIKKVKRKK